MKYAPIVIPTLNRLEHLQRCIKSLQSNDLAKHSDLYIAVDYPPSKKYEQGYIEICSWLKKGIKGFKTVNIIYREKNFGAIGNYIALVDEVLANYDRIIILEDDNELSPCFIDFCNKGLEIYENDNSVVAINASNYVWSGEGMTIAKSTNTNNVKKRQLLFHAYATWKNKWEEIKRWCDTGDIIKDWYKDGNAKKIWRKSHIFYFTFVDNVLYSNKNLPWVNGRICIIDQVWDYYMLMYDKYVICPFETLTKDWGCDGSGVNFKEVFANKNDILRLSLLEDKEFEYRNKEELLEDTNELYLHDHYGIKQYRYNKPKTIVREIIRIITIYLMKQKITLYQYR